MKPLFSEWWEVWIYMPNRDPVRVSRYGEAFDFRVPREGFPTRAEAIAQATGNDFAKVIHVKRIRRIRSRAVASS
jgi:hypothetical protein